VSEVGAKSASPLELAQLTDVGRVREHNEDDLLAWQLPVEHWSPHAVLAVLAVADGMGGHQRGEVASAMAIEALGQALCQPDSPCHFESAALLRRYLSDTVQACNRRIHDLGTDGQTDCPGTTLTAVALCDDSLVVAHVGDSRAYLLRDGRLDQLTDDHSYVAEQVRAGHMTEEAARTSPFRGSLTRCLGSQAEVKVDLVTAGCRRGDLVLVCSDGLSEYVQREEIEAVLNQAKAQAAVSQLVAAALARGGEDNVSVAAMQCGPRAIAAGPTPISGRPPLETARPRAALTAAAAVTQELPRVGAPPTSRARRLDWPPIIVLALMVMVLIAVIGWPSRPKPAAAPAPLPAPVVTPEPAPPTPPEPTPAPKRLGPAGGHFEPGTTAVYRDREHQALNIRQGPSRDEEIATKAPWGATLTVLGQQDLWVHVQYQGVVGWCAWHRPGDQSDRYLFDPGEAP
jgi:serine/threonine protein phosphatase PrpC